MRLLPRKLSGRIGSLRRTRHSQQVYRARDVAVSCSDDFLAGARCSPQNLADIWVNRGKLPGHVALRSLLRNRRFRPRPAQGFSLSSPCKMSDGEDALISFIRKPFALFVFVGFGAWLAIAPCIAGQSSSFHGAPSSSAQLKNPYSGDT